jgi:hypothetical protein
VRRITALLSVAAVVALGLGATPLVASAAVSPAAGLNAFTLDGNGGSYLLGSGHMSFTGPQVTMRDSGSGGVSLSGQSATNGWTAMVSPSEGASLSVGTFETRRIRDATYWGLDIFGDGRGCNEDVGSITVHEVV